MRGHWVLLALFGLAAACTDTDEPSAPTIAGGWQVTMAHAACDTPEVGSMTLIARSATELTGTYDIPESSRCSHAFGTISVVANFPDIYIEIGDVATLTGTYDAHDINASGFLEGYTPPDIALWATR